MDATAKSQPNRVLIISVRPRNGLTQLSIRDVTPPEAKPGLSTDERWRRVGLYSDGRLIDPTHLQ